MARDIRVELVGDSSKLERAFKRGEKSAAGFNASLTRLNRPAGGLKGIGGIFAAGTTAAAIRDTVNAASDLNEEIGKTDVVFGRSAASVEEWAQTTADAFGVSQRQALATASSFGALFAPIGIVGEEAAKQSRKLTELGADLASFYNTNVQDALDAITSGIVGEMEPLRRYGVRLSETRVQQLALTNTGKDSVKQLTEQEKALARLQIIFKDSAKAHGDSARSMGRLAEQSKVLSANIDELKVNLGESLIPVLTDVTKGLNKMFAAMKKIKAPAGGALDFINKLKGPSLLEMFGVKGKPGASLLEILAGRGGGQPPSTPLKARGGGLADALGLAFPGSTTAPRARRPGRQGFPGSAALQAAADDAASIAELNKAAARRRETAKANREAAILLRRRIFDARIARQLDRAQDLKPAQQLARLKVIAAEVRARMLGTKDATRRLDLEDQYVSILREERSIQADIADQIKAANQALKDRAEAIKSAVVDRLQQRQTDVLNKRALADAKEQLRIARGLGGKFGIREASRAVQDAQFDILRARVERARPSLTKGGRFGLGEIVTINVHGVTDPEQVARQVVAALQKRGRRTSSQSRGTGSANATAVPGGAR